MLNTIRRRTEKHCQLEYKEARAFISHEEKKKLKSLRIGFEGELQFDSIVNAETPELIHFKDYRFVSDQNEYQIDNILLTGDNLFLFEVKNFSFDLKYTTDIWKLMNGKDWVNPITQVDQQRNKFNQLLSLVNYQLPVYSNIVFINPSQTIYNLVEHPKVHTYSNIRKRLKHIYKENTLDHTQLLNHLNSLHVTHSKYSKPTDIILEKMKKGIICSKCFNYLDRISQKRFVCKSCKTFLSGRESAKELIHEMKIYNSQSELSSYQMTDICGGLLSSSLFRTQDVRLAWKYKSNIL